jgi:RNA polymerase sigma-70 factor (ECF subfamily)
LRFSESRGSKARRRDIFTGSVSLRSATDALQPLQQVPQPSRALTPAVSSTDPAQRLVEVVQRHHALVWRTLRRFGLPVSDADDATQQVFLTFAQRSAHVEARQEVSFLVSVAIKVAANLRRKVVRRREVGVDEAELVSNQSPESLLEQKQLREMLDRGLSTLLPEQRAIFVLFELEGFSLPQIAELFEIPLGTATSRLRRARDHLEAWLREQPDGEVS